MNREEFAALESRVEARAKRLWEEAGRPESGAQHFVEEARQLVAFEEVPPPTLDPESAAEPAVEEAALQENLGEFPGLRDQGDEQGYPATDPYAEDDVRLSDGDASETGGVLPRDRS